MSAVPPEGHDQLFHAVVVEVGERRARCAVLLRVSLAPGLEDQDRARLVREAVDRIVEDRDPSQAAAPEAERDLVATVTRFTEGGRQPA